MKKMKQVFLIIFLAVIFFTKAGAQNALPDFSAEDIGKSKIRISWINPFGENCIQLMVQVSYDSLKNFRTATSKWICIYTAISCGQIIFQDILYTRR
jgi:hypothetical protein